jgi:hypothetical protein
MWKRPFMKKSSPWWGLFFLISGLVGMGCSNGDVAFVLPQPDVEGVDDQYAVVCGGVSDADPGTQISVVSPTGSFKSTLALDGSFSVVVCWSVGNIATTQFLDQDDNPLTILMSDTREDLNGPDVCPDPTNPPPPCS